MILSNDCKLKPHFHRIIDNVLVRLINLFTVPGTCQLITGEVIRYLPNICIRFYCKEMLYHIEFSLAYNIS